MATQVTLNSGSVDSAGSLALKTNGTTTAVTIDASQNVGIGTVSPTAKLDTSNSNGRNARIGGMQISGTTTTADAGNNFVSSGAYWNGTNYTATATTSVITQYGNGALNFYTDSGLTAGNTFTASSRMTLDSSGNVGIGTSSPSSFDSTGRQLVVGNGSAAQGMTIYTSSSTAGNIFFAKGTTSSDPYRGFIQYGQSGLSGASDAMLFGTAATERMRIDSSGNLLVGGTTTYGAVTVAKAAPSAPYGQICAFSPTAGDSNISGMSIVKYSSDTSTAQVMIRFLIGTGANGQGQINANGANTVAFGSYSDSRLKENIVDLPSQLDNIMALRPVEYDYIESMGGGHQIGFVAQEVQAIYPDLVGENEDGMLTLTDMNKNDARLIKAIQEMKAIIDAQASTITTLTDRITALENK